MKEYESKRFNKASFCIKIVSQENHTWHGTITWFEENKTINFRSALELIKLIDSAFPDEKRKFDIS